jgi:hypothetical protein
VKSASSGDYAASDYDGRGTTRPADASSGVSTEIHENDGRAGPGALPAPTADLFIMAGAVLADRASREHADQTGVEVILRRAVAQAAALRGEV